MKILLLLLTLSFVTSAATDYDFLTENQRQEVLDAIDNTCGDTWCEADFDFEFHDIICSAKMKTCTVTMDLTDTYDEDNLETFPVSCTMTNLSKFSDILEATSPNYFELRLEFYEDISDCLAEY